MTLRFSTGARAGLLQSSGFSGMFNRGSCSIYSGAQPASADAAATGTLLGVVTANSLPLTQEVQAAGAIVITGGATAVDTVTVGTFNIIPDGPVLYNTSTAQTAADLADAINRNGIFSASVVGPAITIKPIPGAGAAYNGLALTSTGGVTATYGGGTVSGGVNSVNGLIFGNPAAGVMGKPTTQIWSFNGIAAGTAGWFRFIGSVADAGGVSSTLVRMDGSIATSGGDMALSNISVLVGAPNTVDRFNMTQPAQ